MPTVPLCQTSPVTYPLLPHNWMKPAARSVAGWGSARATESGRNAARAANRRRKDKGRMINPPIDERQDVRSEERRVGRENSHRVAKEGKEKGIRDFMEEPT